MRRASASRGLLISSLKGIISTRCSSLIPASLHWLAPSSASTWTGKANQQSAKCVFKRKRSFTVCLIISALGTLFCLSMLIQVLILSSNKVVSGKRTLESFFDVRLNRNPSSIDWSPSRALESAPVFDGQIDYTQDSRYRENAALTVASQWHGTGFDYWQPVSTSSHKFFVYSAYVDSYKRSNLNLLNAYSRATHDDPDYFVRVIAVTQLNTKDKVTCCYNSPSNHSHHPAPETTCREGSLRAIREHWSLTYSAYFLYCPLPRQLSDDIANLSLSIVAVNDKRSALTQQNAQLLRSLVPSNRLAIHANVNDQFSFEDDPSIAVCVKPLHFHYNKGIPFIEFLELNRLLGVRHFYFYNHTVGPEVDLILRNLAQSEPSLITTLPWLLPFKSQTEIRTEGIFAALNDCLYRARKDQFRYVLFIDLDEYIIPQRHETLNEMIAALRSIYAGQVGAFSFRNAFFYLQYPNEPIEVADGEQQQPLVQQLITLTKTKRKAILNIHKQRSKFIAVPEDTIEVGNHFVWKLNTGKHMLNVNADIAKVNHYRKCEYGGDECILQSAAISDRRIQLWASKLIGAVHQQLRSLCASQPIRLQWQMCQFAGSY